jgi:hypothetical protein
VVIDGIGRRRRVVDGVTRSFAGFDEHGRQVHVDASGMKIGGAAGLREL